MYKRQGVRITQAFQGEPCDLLIALHARRSYGSIERYARERPGAPLIVALTGTDLYGDIHESAEAKASLRLATRLVLLQPLGIHQLSETLHDKTRTVRQSASRPRVLRARLGEGARTACVLAHLREVKDPLLAADAARLLPDDSQIRIFHLGAAMDESMAERAKAAAKASKGRWRWIGECSRTEALRTLAAADLLVLTSVQEGGANVVTEAIACGVPVLSTRIEGSRGILGEDYPGYFEPGDAEGLAAMLRRCEKDPVFYATLRERCAALQPLVDPANERESWRSLLGELFEKA